MSLAAGMKSPSRGGAWRCRGMDQKDNTTSLGEGENVASSSYTARKEDMCVLPVKNDILCPHCADKRSAGNLRQNPFKYFHRRLNNEFDRHDRGTFTVIFYGY